MNALFLILLTFLGYILAYHTYGATLAKRIFKLDDKNKVPAEVYEDGKDFVPTKKGVIFGHHFTSIAGTGPIVGPAIGVIWGWGPALVWVLLGSIFMGAVHDFSSLVISLRNKGESISSITEKYINKRVRLMFYMIVCLALWIVLAIFGLVIALIFARFPESVVPIWTQIPIAMGLGFLVFKRGANLILSTLVAVALMYITVILGGLFPIQLTDFFGIPPTGIWTFFLLLYAFLASVMPVTMLLQPRDYINAWQLLITLGLIVLGILITGVTQPLPMSAPVLNPSPVGAPPMWPFLFITIACGAVSGFHCMVSSGTSSKQLSCESDAKFVGYGSMLIEAALATVVIVAVTAGIGLSYTSSGGEVLTGLSAWEAHYGSWEASAGLGSKLTAVVIGCANFMEALGIPTSIGVIIVGVFIASFAGTTLDTATRIQRYVIAELFAQVKGIGNKWVASGLAVLTAGVLAFSTGLDGDGALALWPLFGAVNQLLASLALMVATMYLKRRGKWHYLTTAIPCVFMLVMTLWAGVSNQLTFFSEQNYLLLILNGLILTLSVLMVAETSLVFSRNVEFARTR